MFELCKYCKNRCKVVLYGSNRVVASNQCFISIDARREGNPIDTNEEDCDYFERQDFIFKRKKGE